MMNLKEMMFGANKKKSLLSFIKMAEQMGLQSVDAENARDLFLHHEFELCFDTVITQLYEHRIKISSEFYNLACGISDELKIEGKNYAFLKELL